MTYISSIIEILIHYIFWFLGFIFLYKIRTLPLTKEKNSNIRFSIVIPARNEEKNINKLLISIKSQTIQPDEIIVVDDCSEDKTSEVTSKFNVKIIKIDKLPEGWTGKNWACYNGAKTASNDLILFLDADVKLKNDCLNNIINEYILDPGIISIQPYHKTCKFYEQFSLFFNIILIGAMGAFTILGKKIKPIGLFGPCILISRNTFLQVVKISNTKKHIIEDIQLGKYLIRKNKKISHFCGKNNILFRMYPEGISQLTRGWSKGFFSGAQSTYFPLLIAIILWISGGIGAVRFLILNSISLNVILLIMSIILYLLYVFQIRFMTRKIGNFHFFTAILFFIPLLFFIIIFIKSFIDTIIKKRTKWKGRNIEIGK